MNGGSSASERLDLTTELRLRRWARQHYVPQAQRSARWHSVVLEEMQRRDAELIAGPSPTPVVLPLEMSYGRRIDCGYCLTQLRTLRNAG